VRYDEGLKKDGKEWSDVKGLSHHEGINGITGNCEVSSLYYFFLSTMPRLKGLTSLSGFE
jgi:hypothetical protein